MTFIRRPIQALLLLFVLSLFACSSGGKSADSIDMTDGDDAGFDQPEGEIGERHEALEWQYGEEEGEASFEREAGDAYEATEALEGEEAAEDSETADFYEDEFEHEADAFEAEYADEIEAEPEEDTATEFEAGLELDLEPELELEPEAEEEERTHIRRLVIAGDSWSTGFIPAVEGALSDHGLSDVTVTWENTAIAGSRAEEWADNEDDKLFALEANLDMQPAAEALLISIGGNDLNAEISNGLADLPNFMQQWRYDDILSNIEVMVNFALSRRPHLTVVLVGYDYLHHEFLSLYANLPGYDIQSYNEAFVELERRKLALAESLDRVWYAHNYGILQWTFGDAPHPPFSLPLVSYEPHTAPFPGYAPNYSPFPGGFIFFPSPLDHLPDGIHPSPEGFRAIIDNTFNQGFLNIVERKGWLE